MAEFNQLGKTYRHWLEPMPDPLHTWVGMSPEERAVLHERGRTNVETRVPPTPPQVEREPLPPRLPRKGQADLTSFDDPYDDEDPDYEG